MDRPGHDWLLGLVKRGLLTPEQATEARHSGDRTPSPLTETSRATAAAAPMSRDGPISGAGKGPPAGAEAFGRYRLDRVLGRSGVGVVYEAFDPVLGRGVALKRLAADEAEFDPAAVARLRHPAIVEVYDVGTIDGRHYFTMELLTGNSLEQELALRPVPDAPLVRGRVERLLPVAEALGLAHAQGIVHRDVKPSNILSDRAGRPVLTDFGLARDMAGARAADGVLVGTMRYAAPERMRSASLAGPASDVFSLGVVLYRAVTGAHPFPGEGAEALVSLMERGPERPSRVNAAVAGDLEAVCLKCLEKEPAARYPDGAALAADLARFLGGLPVEARRPFPTRGGGGSSRERVAEGRGREEALRLLERGRPVLDLAHHVRYARDANAAELARRTSEAQRFVEKALEMCPDLPLAHDLLGRAWEIRGWDDLAEACWRNTLRLDRAFAPAHFHLGRLLVEKAFLVRMNYVAADVAERQQAAQAVAREAEAEMQAALAGAHELEWELPQRVAAAMSAYSRGDGNETERICFEALAEFPQSQGREELHWLVGISRGGAASLPEFDRAIAIRPRYALALYCRSIQRRKQGDMAGAVADIEEALRVKPRFMEAWTSRSFLMQQLKRYVEAAENAHRAVELRPGEAIAWLNRGAAKWALGDLPGAEADFDRAARIHGRYATALSNRGQARLALGDVEAARRDLLEALAITKERATIWTNYGIVLHAAGDFAGAIAAFDEAILRDPRYDLAHVERARTLEARGDLRGAAAALDVLLAQRPVSEARLVRGRIRRRLGDLEGAGEDFEAAVATGPDEPEAWAALGDFRAEWANREGAVEAWRKALALPPGRWREGPRVEAALRALTDAHSDPRLGVDPG
ncbi:MAG: protein kinase [Planctomycetes bacterium]|nr:protein kinase [Planctomycetota bacterium]